MKSRSMIPSDIGLPNSPGVQKKFGVDQYGKIGNKIKKKMGKVKSQFQGRRK